VKFELKDNDRRKEIIEFWMNLNITNDEMWYELTYIVAFSYRVASMLRKRYYYLMDRGVAKQIAAALVADYFVRHHLEYISDKMNIIPNWWIVFHRKQILQVYRDLHLVYHYKTLLQE